MCISALLDAEGALTFLIGKLLSWFLWLKLLVSPFSLKFSSYIYRIHISFELKLPNNSKIRICASVHSVEATVATSSIAEMYILYRYSFF